MVCIHTEIKIKGTFTLLFYWPETVKCSDALLSWSL